MVFESLVADLLNRYIGDYVENLDRKQLNIGIFGGDVVLKNLQVKQTALDELDLPVKLKYGQLGELVLKIPWKNLYQEPVVATISDLYVIAVPNRGIKYNAEKEERYAQEAKQKSLTSLQERRDAQKQQGKETKQADGFAEKLATQVIKNLQVRISNIHVRFEDEFTNRERPFSVGVTLKHLNFQTTNTNWVPTGITDAVKFIFKLVDLQGLACYWNSATELYSSMTDNEQIKKSMAASIVVAASSGVGGFSYVLDPISIKAKLRLNSKPELDETNWQTPKVWLSLSVEELGLRLTKYQYQDVMEFLEGLDRMTISARYRKYRPDLAVYHGHAREWWHFAYTCVLEDEVRRRRRNWSWDMMRKHRELYKQYKKAWLEKLTKPKPSKDALATIERAEKTLDLFNLNVARQEVEAEMERRGLKRAEEQAGWGGWLGSFWGSGSAKKSGVDDIAAKFNEAMTADEKAKLYAAIDYSENQSTSLYPIEFIENHLEFYLARLTVSVFDQPSKTQTLKAMTVALVSASASLLQRPADNGALRLELRVCDLNVRGIPDPTSGIAPIICALTQPAFVDDAAEEMPVSAVNSAKVAELLYVLFETRPLDRSCDLRLQLATQPLNVVYHAESVNKLAEVFRPPESVHLKQLTAAAFAKYERAKARSSTALEYALQFRSVMQLDISVHPTLLVVPERGVYDRRASLLLVDFGKLNIRTLSSEAGPESPKAKTEAERRKELVAKAYDRFEIELSNLQVLFARQGDDWKSARSDRASRLHLLEPSCFNLQLERCTIDDIALPKLRIVASLPNFTLNVSELKLIDITRLLVSIPTPPPQPVPAHAEISVGETRAADRGKLLTIMEDEVDISPAAATTVAEVEQQIQTSFEALVALDEIALNMFAVRDDREKMEVKVVLRRLGADFRQRTSDMRLKMHLGDVYVEHFRFKAWNSENSNLKLVENPFASVASTQQLIELEFIQADRNYPNFASEFASTETKITIQTKPLYLNLHQQAMVELQKLANKITSGVAEVQEQQRERLQLGEDVASPRTPRRTPSMQSLRSAVSEMGTTIGRKTSSTKKAPRAKKLPTVEDKIINMKFEAVVDSVGVTLGREGCLFSTLNASVLKAVITMTKAKMLVGATVGGVEIRSPSLSTTYPKIVFVPSGSEVLRFDFTQFNRSELERASMKATDVDMAVSLRTAELRFVFLNAWLQTLLAFIAPFQGVAQEAAAQAGSAIAAGAKESAQKMYKQTTKISLDVELRAPVVLFPKNSNSTDALLINLGQLRLKNRFITQETQLAVAGSANTAVILDEMTVEMSETRLARARVKVVDGKADIIAECRILEPVSFKLLLTRNLSFEWNRSRPEITIKAILPALTMSLSSEDYEVVLQAAAENFAEVGDEKMTIDEPAGGAPSATAAIQEAADVAHVVVDVHEPPKEEEKKEVEGGKDARMVFAFQLDSIALRLYSGTSSLVSGVVERDARRSLASLDVLAIHLDGTMLVDTSMRVALWLNTFTLSDSRVGFENGITKLIHKRESKSRSDERIFKLDFVQDSSQNQSVDLVVTPLTFCFCPEFLAAVAAFFTPRQSKAKPVATTKTQKRREGGAGKPKKTGSNAAPPPPRTGTLAVKVSVQKPEVLLVNDAAHPEESKALILKLAANLNYLAAPDKENISGAVDGFEIFMSYYAAHRRREHFVPVMKPVEIALHSAKETSERRHNVDIRVSELVLKISPLVVQLLSSAATQFGAEQTVKEEERAVDEAAQKKDTGCEVWKRKALEEKEWWFLCQEEEAMDAEELLDEITAEGDVVSVFDEQMMLHCESFYVTVEAGFGAKTIPLVLLDAKSEVAMRDWSSQMSGTASLSLEMAYYNELLSVWEPLIEPVESADGSYRPWELLVDLQTTADQLEDVDAELPILPPKMTINTVATDVMQVTVTRTFLDVVNKLSDVFVNAARQIPAAPPPVELDTEHEFHISNQTGIEVEILPTGDVVLAEEVRAVKPGGVIGAFRKSALSGGAGVVLKPGRSPSTAAGLGDVKVEESLMLHLQIPSMNTVRQINLSRSDKRVFLLPQRTQHPGDQWALVVEIKSEFGQQTVVLRSVLQVVNMLNVPVEVFYLVDTSLYSSGVVEKDGGVLYLPYGAVYTPSGELYFKPAGEGQKEIFSASTEGVNWRSFGTNILTTNAISCDEVSGSAVRFFIQVAGELDHGCFENTHRKNLTSQCYKIYLRPTMIMQNMLPYGASVLLPGSTPISIKSGESTPLLFVAPGEHAFLVRLTDYTGEEWTCQMNVEPNPDVLIARSFVSANDATRTLDLPINCTSVQGCLTLCLFAPFWMLNKTGQDLEYQDPTALGEVVGGRRVSCGCTGRPSTAAADDEVSESGGRSLRHPASVNEPMPFSSSAKTMFAKKQICLRANDSEWSSKFSLDTVGSSGRIVCTARSGNFYDVCVNIHLSSCGLTKIVTFTPFYILSNKCSSAVEVREAAGVPDAPWLPILPDECRGFWPQQTGKRLLMSARYVGAPDNAETVAFPFSETFEALLRLHSDKIGMRVSSQVSESSVFLTFEDYSEGMAAVFVVNATSASTVKFTQKEEDQWHELPPKTGKLYAWESMLTPRELAWSCGEKRNVVEKLVQDGVGSFANDDKTMELCWVSFLDGHQRVLMFTDDAALAMNAQEAYELERCDTSLTVSLQGLGVSLVDNVQMLEVAYISITSSGVVWEWKKRQRWKAFSIRECTQLEQSYEKYTNQMQVDPTKASARAKVEKIEVSFEQPTMRQLKPQEREIRRAFQTGFSLTYKLSPHSVQISAKVNRLQIDNQLPACVFPTVVSRFPIAKSVAAESLPKPLVELSYISRRVEHSSVQQIKYFGVLIQELDVKADQGFINALIAFFANASASNANMMRLYESDIESASKELVELAAQSASAEQRAFYDLIHFSPIKIHLSYSQGGSSGAKGEVVQIQSAFINLFMKSIGVTLTEIQDVVFKLAYFEEKSQFINQSMLQQMVIRHYTKQAIKQFYVLVLGLDVIGNPFGLIRNLTDGVQDFFYEPIQGAIQGPDEFAEGLAIGVKSLFGHAIGGAAGAVSRITGTLGKGIAALTMDDEFQRKRQERLNRRPAGLTEGVAQSGKGLVMGVVDGVTGVFLRPIEGAQQEGATGFVKGVGKGLIGLVARPVAGVVDFASGSLEAVKRATDVSDEVARVRLPRFIQADGMIRPYNTLEAEGNRIFLETNKGKYTATDVYFAHAVISKKRKEVLLLTDRRVMFVRKSEVFGVWECDWDQAWHELRECPKLNEAGQLELTLKEKKKKVLGVFGSSHLTKKVNFPDPKVATFMCARATEAYRKANS